MSVSAGDNIKLDWEQQEDPAKLAEFQARIDARELIEADDWMPSNYRIGMLRMAEHHANSEIVGALPEGEWITRAPSLKRKLSLIAKVQDEVGHGQMLYRVSQDLGKPRDQMLRDLITGKTKYHNVFNYPAPTWADVAAIQWLVDGAAIMNQKTLADGSYGPYVRTMRRINMEEAFHFKVGEDSVLTLMSGTPRQKKMMQEAFDRWWNPCLMFFGPPDKESVKTGPFMQWRIKTATNDELRQAFVDRFVPAALDLGLEIKTYKRQPVGDGSNVCAACGLGRAIRNPDGSAVLIKDEMLKLDPATKHWQFSPPDWEEFFAVIRGHGPLNKQRVGLRRMSYEQGEWVRRAVLGQPTGLPPSAN
jgi:ring-1,2-phenylacetyl-CoA epoxidase subunit PaaA